MSLDIKYERIVCCKIHKLLGMFISNSTFINVTLSELINFEPCSIFRFHNNFAESRAIAHNVLYVSRFIRACRQ